MDYSNVHNDDVGYGIARAFVVKNGTTVTRKTWVKLGAGVLLEPCAVDDNAIGICTQTVVGDGTKKAVVIIAGSGKITTTAAAIAVGDYVSCGAAGAAIKAGATKVRNGIALSAVPATGGEVDTMIAHGAGSLP